MKKVVVVTGAASGIGQAIAKRAARDGDTVVIVDIKAMGETAAQIEAAGGHSVSCECDVSDSASVDDMFSAVEETHGPVDVLINNAGTMGRWPLTVTEAAEDDWHTVFEANVKSAFLCCRRAIPAMRARRAGNIVNIGSELAIVAAEGCALYCASKAAIVHFTRALAVDEAKHGIRVNCICPGPVDTALLNPTVGDDGPSARAASAQSTLINRLGTPAEIAELTWFVASGRVNFMVGSAILADGGVTAV